jgi:hypothetical protein
MIVQCMNHKFPGAFLAYPSWREGFRDLVEISKRKHVVLGPHNVEPVTVVYEHQVPKFPSRIIIDFDLKESEFGGRFSLAELQGAAEAFPRWFHERLLEMKAIAPSAPLIMTRKNKCRQGKISFHFTTNILVNPRESGASVLRAVLVEPFVEDRKKAKELGGWSFWPEGVPLCPGIGADPATTHGRCQFSMWGGGKPNESMPRVDERVTLIPGSMKVETPPWDQSDNTPNNIDALDILYWSCFSHYTEDMITLSPEYTRRESRTHDKGPAGPRVKRGGSAPNDPRSVRLSNGMPCVRKVAEKLVKKWKGLNTWHVWHVQGLRVPCPTQGLRGIEDIHMSNSLYAAKYNGKTFLRCITCVNMGYDENKSLYKPLDTTLGDTYPWVVYEGLDFLPKI